MYKSFFSLLLLIAASFTAYAQETPHATGFKPALSLEPFFGLSKAFIPAKERQETKTSTGWGGSYITTTYAEDKHSTELSLEGGFRTLLQLDKTWGIKTETGIQQLAYTRTMFKEIQSNGNISQSQHSGSAHLLYFYQSLEANYKPDRNFSVSAGGFAGTLLSSEQAYLSMRADESALGIGLRDTRLGTQASISYLHAIGLTATLNIRQDLKSIYTSDAQLAGPISPTSLSLTVGYRFMVAN